MPHHPRHTIRGYGPNGWMSLTIHLYELDKVDENNGFRLFKPTDEHVAKWKGKMTTVGAMPLRYYFRKDLFDEVSISFCIFVTIR
jgi:hypothetical protein